MIVTFFVPIVLGAWHFIRLALIGFHGTRHGSMSSLRSCASGSSCIRLTQARAVGAMTEAVAALLRTVRSSEGLGKDS